MKFKSLGIYKLFSPIGVLLGEYEKIADAKAQCKSLTRRVRWPSGGSQDCNEAGKPLGPKTWWDRIGGYRIELHEKRTSG